MLIFLSYFFLFGSFYKFQVYATNTLKAKRPLYEYNVLIELKQSLLKKNTQRYYEYLISILRNEVFKNVAKLRNAYKEKSVHYCLFEPFRKVVVEHYVEKKMRFSFQ